jgi:hypothetical protein
MTRVKLHFNKKCSLKWEESVCPKLEGILVARHVDDYENEDAVSDCIVLL